MKSHDEKIKIDKEDRKKRLHEIKKGKNGALFNDKLSKIKKDFLGFFSEQDTQKRGYNFEKILYELFLLFDLNPKSSFRRQGEQIDGAFSIENDQYLLEAKWREKKTDLSDLRDLDGAVNSSLDNTLGLFISLNGFSDEALGGYLQGNRPKVICMDGTDLMAVLEGQIDLKDIIKRKKDIAVHKRVIMASISDIIKGKY